MNISLEFLADASVPVIMGFALGSVMVEWLLLAISHKLESHKEGLVSVISAALVFFPVFILNKIVLVSFMLWLYQFRLIDLGFAWYIWPIAWVVYDFIWWVFHWAGHNIRLIWCLHSAHHTPKEMKLSVAFRGSFADFLISPHQIIWLPLLGFHPYMILIVETLGRFYGILVHINEKWVPNKRRSWIEKIFVSPSMHRVHHSVNPLYLDRNYGEAFAIWDIIFQTYQAELPSEKPIYGTMKEIDSENLLDTQTSEFRALWQDIQQAHKLSDKIKYIFMPPGWNHLGTGTLAKQMREEAIV